MTSLCSTGPRIPRTAKPLRWPGTPRAGTASALSARTSAASLLRGTLFRIARRERQWKTRHLLARHPDRGRRRLQQPAWPARAADLCAVGLQPRTRERGNRDCASLSMTRRAVVIGAGPGGLAAAMLLATVRSRGHACIERREVVGGRSATICALDDRGPSPLIPAPPSFSIRRLWEEVFSLCGLRSARCGRADPARSAIPAAVRGWRADRCLARCRAHGRADRRDRPTRRGQLPGLPGREPCQVRPVRTGIPPCLPRASAASSSRHAACFTAAAAASLR